MQNIDRHHFTCHVSKGSGTPLPFCLLLLIMLVSGCGGGGGDGDGEGNSNTTEKIEISGAILIPGGPESTSTANPLGLIGAANKPVSLYRIDDTGQIIGDVLDTTTSDQNGNYVLLLPADIEYASDIVVEAIVEPAIGPKPAVTARAIVLDETTDVTPITEYITEKLINAVPALDMNALPLEEVAKLVAFVESLPLTPLSDFSGMVAEIETVADIVVDAEINDQNTTNQQVRLSGLLSAPSGPVADAKVDLYEIDSAGKITGEILASTTTNTAGVFTLLLPEGQDLSSDLTLESTVDTEAIRALVVNENVNLNAASEYVFNQIIEREIEGEWPVSKIYDLVVFVENLDIEEEQDLQSTLDAIDAAAGTEVSTQLDTIVSDTNANAPVVQPGGPFDLFENSADTTAIGTVNATDADPLGSITGFSITAGNTGTAFAIDNGGAITVANSAALDRETNPSFTLTVTATDGTNVSAGVNFVIDLTDLNDNVPVIGAAQSFGVSESAINSTLVGNVSASDADTGGTTGFTITGGNTGNAFAIDSAGRISVANAAALDRESNPSFTLTLTATDGTNISTAENVTININDANDNAPVVDAVGPFVVAEDAANTTPVGTVTATDIDTAGTITGFAITAGNTGNAFAIDAAGLISVANTGAVDFESATSFTLTVTATDGVNTSAGQAVTINVSDANDAAPVVDAVGPFVLAENSATTTAVGTVTATDVDTIGGVTGYSIVAGNTGNAFAIDNSGAITVATSIALDRETTASFTLTVTSTDGINVSTGENVIVNLTDLNDTAPVITPGQAFLVSNSVANSALVGTVIATDADTTGSVTGFSITAGNTGSTFAIATDGQVTVLSNVALLAGSPYTLTITATDGSNTSIAETVGITVFTGSTAVWDSFNWDDGSTWQ